MGTTKWGRERILETAERLTPAEAKTYELVQAGMSRREVAQAMGVKLGTVHERMAILKQKLLTQEYDR